MFSSLAGFSDTVYCPRSDTFRPRELSKLPERRENEIKMVKRMEIDDDYGDE